MFNFVQHLLTRSNLHLHPTIQILRLSIKVKKKHETTTDPVIMEYICAARYVCELWKRSTKKK